MFKTSQSVRNTTQIISLILATTALSSCHATATSSGNASGGSTPNPAPTELPQKNAVCPKDYEPLPLELGSPAKAASFDDVLAKGTLTFHGVQFFTEFKYPDQAPIQLHDEEGKDGKLGLVCEAQSPNGFYVAGLDTFIPAEISMTGNPADGSAVYTSKIRKYTLFTDDGDLALKSEEDTTLGTIQNPLYIVQANFQLKDYRFYETAPNQFELHLETGGDTEIVRMIVQYDFKAN